jgi:hypothetical protein
MNDTAKPKLCTECKYFTPEIVPALWWFRPSPLPAKYAKCAHPSQLDLVSGDATTFCSINRETGGACGTAAKLFEPKLP